MPASPDAALENESAVQAGASHEQPRVDDAQPVTESDIADADIADAEATDDDLDDDSDEDAPLVVPDPPKQRGNRLFATFVVLAATGVFQALWIGAFVLYIVVGGGSASLSASLTQFSGLIVAWLPAVAFFVLFEAVVLLVDRAPKTVYVIASLIVGVAVYALTVLLYVQSVAAQGTTITAANVGQVFESLLFVLIGVIAREVMLWGGIAIAARGARVKAANAAANAEYESSLAALD